MNRNRTGELRRRAGLALLAGAVLTSVAFAQESDDGTADSTPRPLDRSNRIVAEYGFWVAQPAGLEYSPVSRINPDDVFGAQPIQLGHSTEGESRWRLAYRLPERNAEISLSYFSHHAISEDGELTPGQFIFGERLAIPAFAGYALDGFADGWEASARTSLRDARLEYRQRIYGSDEGPELTASIGWARVWHSRRQSARYYALIPDIPPLLPPLSSPRPDLAPRPDDAALRSRFEGRGLTAGLELRVPLVRDRLLLEAAADLSVLRGKTDVAYSSVTHGFTLDGELLPPPYDVFGEAVETPPGSGVFDARADDIDQVTYRSGQTADSVSTSSDVQRLSLGLRWRSLDWLDVFGGFRSARYTDVGIDLLPGPAASQINAAQDYRRENRSATYEGFYIGVAFHLF